jgi:hypothetical protein
MTDKFKISAEILSSDNSVPLGMTISIDGKTVWHSGHITDVATWQHEVDDAPGSHQMTFEMFGKLPDHTDVDEQGNIVRDAMLTVRNIKLDDIDISQIMTDKAKYHHDFNGSQALLEDKFFGDLGCNGQVVLEFTTPLYLWLLENM